MRKILCSVATAIALIGGSAVLTAGTAQAATPVKTGCLSYTWIAGQGFVPTTGGCYTSSTGTSSTGTTSGTSTNGTVINNCNTGCTGSATGTAGTSSWWPW